MKRRTYGARVTRRLLTSLLAAGACFVAAQPAFQGERQPAPAGGMTIHIDPQTGTILKEPAPGTVPLQLTPELQNRLSTSDTGLVEVPSALPGKGVKIDLQGRFQSPLIVTIDANGQVKMQHLDEAPGSAGKP